LILFSPHLFLLFSSLPSSCLVSLNHDDRVGSINALDAVIGLGLLLQLALDGVNSNAHRLKITGTNHHAAASTAAISTVGRAASAKSIGTRAAHGVAVCSAALKVALAIFKLMLIGLRLTLLRLHLLGLKVTDAAVKSGGSGGGSGAASEGGVVGENVHGVDNLSVVVGHPTLASRHGRVARLGQGVHHDLQELGFFSGRAAGVPSLEGELHHGLGVNGLDGHEAQHGERGKEFGEHVDQVS
jgi:hypothetical protein